MSRRDIRGYKWSVFDDGNDPAAANREETNPRELDLAGGGPREKLTWRAASLERV